MAAGVDAGSEPMSSKETAVFGLSADALRPIVEHVAGGKVALFDATVVPHDWKRYGIRGEKLTVLVEYTTARGERKSAKLFVKKQGDPVVVNGTPIEPRLVEAHHYAHLSACAAPIPQFYGALTVHDPSPREILFLEWIERVVTEGEPWSQFQSDPPLFGRYLQALARFNSIVPSREYDAMLPKPHSHFLHQMAGGPAKLDRVWSLARKGRLGETVAALCTQKNRDRLDQLWEDAGRDIARMPMGLSGGDHEPFQSGRRRNGEVVFFDFDLAGYAPRFNDVAVTLGAPEEYCPRCAPTEELARCCLDEYCRRGPSVSLRDFTAETRALWIAWTIGWIDYSYEAETADGPSSTQLLGKKLESLLRNAR
jgi:hypothetical protein